MIFAILAGNHGLVSLRLLTVETYADVMFAADIVRVLPLLSKRC